MASTKLSHRNSTHNKLPKPTRVQRNIALLEEGHRIHMEAVEALLKACAAHRKVQAWNAKLPKDVRAMLRGAK
jgi:hypothetical protein